MRSTLPQSTPVCDRAGTGVNGNDLTKYSRCSMEMKFVANAEMLTPRCSGAAFSTFVICRFKSPWIPVVACPRMLWSAAGMTRALVSALDTQTDCVVALPLSINPNLTVGRIKRGMNTIAATSSGYTVANRVRRFLFSPVVDPLRLIHPTPRIGHCEERSLRRSNLEFFGVENATASSLSFQ